MSYQLSKLYVPIFICLVMSATPVYSWHDRTHLAVAKAALRERYHPGFVRILLVVCPSFTDFPKR